MSTPPTTSSTLLGPRPRRYRALLTPEDAGTLAAGRQRTAEDRRATVATIVDEEVEKVLARRRTFANERRSYGVRITPGRTALACATGAVACADDAPSAEPAAGEDPLQ